MPRALAKALRLKRRVFRVQQYSEARGGGVWKGLGSLPGDARSRDGAVVPDLIQGV